jgi:hypothetical protein
MNNKRAEVSAMVATILIIMITIAVVGIIWVTVIPMIKNSVAPEIYEYQCGEETKVNDTVVNLQQDAFDKLDNFKHQNWEILDFCLKYNQYNDSRCINYYLDYLTLVINVTESLKLDKFYKARTCLDIEVEQMILNNSCDEKLKNSKPQLQTCGIVQDTKVVFSRYNLTRNFLDLNCECKNLVYGSWSTAYCSEYKCGENYKIVYTAY